MTYIQIMTENDRHPQSEGVKDTDTVNISTIIIVVIVTAMFLGTYYMSSLSAVDIQESTFVQRLTDHFDNNKNGFYAKLTATVVDLDKSETSVGLRQQRTTRTETVSDLTNDQRSSKFRLAKRSLIGALESENRVWPSIEWSRLASHKTNQYSMDRDPENLTDHTVELWDIKSRSNRHNHWNTKSNELVGHQTLYDLTYGIDHNNALKYADANEISEIEFKPHYSFDNGAYYGSIIKNSPTTHYRPPLKTLSVYSIQSPQTKISTLNNEMFDWHTVGLLALVKIGLIKFKLFGILKILFLLLFKLKLFLVSIFLKFHLLLKFSKFFKKLYILPLFPIIVTLILIIIFSAAMYFLPRHVFNMMPTSHAAFSSISNLLRSLLSNLPSMLARSGLKKSFKSDKLTHFPINILVSRSGIFKFNDRSFSNKLDADSLRSIDPTLNIFYKL